MKNLIVLGFISLIILISCQNSNHDISEADSENEHSELSFKHTLFSDKLEMYLEHKPLIINEYASFVIHFTQLDGTYKPLKDAKVSIKLTINGNSQIFPATKTDVAGIYTAKVKSYGIGKASIIFIVEKDTLKDSFLIENIQIYKDLKSIKISEDETPNQISYLKEQAWKTDFKVELVQKILFTSIIKTSGQILSAPGDEIIITATSSGQVRFVKSNLLQGISIAKGTRLFEIETSDLTDGNLETKYNEAKANYEKAKADLQRAELLVKDKIISDKDYLVTKNDYSQSEINLKTYSKNTQNGKKNIYSQLDGFIKKIYVHNGDYVSTGQQLASISKNKTLILQADLSSQFYSKLNKIFGANFKSIGNDITFDIKDFNGKIVSYAKSSDALTFYTPIYFELINNGELVPGSFAEVFLKTKDESQQVVIPMTALTEESGKFFVYVQISGESYFKKEVELGDNDGINIVVLQGLSEGERVVTRGAIQVKMASASTAIPHGHGH